jgi:serine protease Do
VAESLGLKNSHGAEVSMVEPGGPADKGGVKVGDIILKFNGVIIERSSDLPRLVGSTALGSKAIVTVWRKGAQQDLSVTIVELEPDVVAQKPGTPKAMPAANALGLAVSDLKPAKKKELQIDGGVVVDAVEGVAARAGLQAGDVLLQLNNTEIRDAKQFNAAVAKLDPKKPSVVLVRRGDISQFVSLRPTAK